MMRTVLVEFRPTCEDTLRLVSATYQELGDPVAVYSKLLSATMVAAAMMDMQPAEVARHAGAFAELAVRILAEREDIFGRPTVIN